MKLVAAILVLSGVGYNLLALAAAVAFRLRRTKSSAYRPPVSILKPLRGRDPMFYEALRSHLTQDYPEFEILCGVADPDDPALEDVRRLQNEFPSVPLSVHITASDAPNAKVGSMEILGRAAKHEILLVSDGDIRVKPDYLARVVSPLADETVGIVTCLYRGEVVAPRGSLPNRDRTLPSRDREGAVSPLPKAPALAEALSIATDFAPGVLVAHLLGTGGFALGATMVFRQARLAQIGGFAAIREHLADDYQLGARIAALPSKVVLSDVVVSTNLGAVSWSGAWKHQVRWARTIRVSRPGGYWGLLFTQVTLWSVIAAALGLTSIAVTGLVIRYAGAAAALWALRTLSPGKLLAVPIRDLGGFVVWVAGLGGNTVEWRNTRFRLYRDGRMRPL